MKSDSLLVKGHVTGEYQAKFPQLTLYLKYFMVLKRSFAEFELVHVPREQNSQVDLLTKLASSRKRGRQRSVIQETLKAPRTTEEGAREVQAKVLKISFMHGRSHRSLTQETLKVPRIVAYDIPVDELVVVLQVDIAETWITPYQCYLVDGLLPVDSTEAKIIKRNAGKYTLLTAKCFVMAMFILPSRV